MAELAQGTAGARLRNLMGWGVLGQLGYVAGQFLLLVALARYASVEDVGRFGLVSAIVLPVYWFFNLGIRANQATDTRGAYRFREFLALRILGSAAAYGLIVLLALVAFDPAARMVLLVFGAAKGVETYSELCYGAFQRAERMSAVALSLILRGFGGALAFGTTIAATGSLTAGYGALLASWALVALLLDLRRALEMAAASGDSGPLRPATVRSLAIQSLPLAFNALLSALQTATPRYVIGQVLGLIALGQFTVLAYALQAATTLTNAIGQSIIARLAHYAASGDWRAFDRVVTRLALMIATATSLAALAMLGLGTPLLTAIFGPDYAGLGSLLALVMVAAGTSALATILQSGLFATRRFAATLRIRAAGFAVTALAATFGALLLSLPGVVLGMIAAAGLQSWLLWRDLRARPRAAEGTR